jgi:acylphosphatase
MVDSENKYNSDQGIVAEIFIVFGRVQGVGFRAFVERAARPFGLSGYVQNLEDGTVRVFVQGQRPSIDGFVHAIRGAPSPIRVQRLERKEAKTRAGLKNFRVEIDSFFVHEGEGDSSSPASG